MRFLGLELAGNAPDARTVWAFREALTQHQLIDALFERLHQVLAALGVELNSMGGIFLRSIGAACANVGVGLMNLTYNLARIGDCQRSCRLKVYTATVQVAF